MFGYLTIRRQGIYFAMITLAFAQMVYFFCVQAKFTGGEDGIQAVPRGACSGSSTSNNTLTMYYFVLAVFLFGFWLIYRTIYSPFGQVMKAIRENEPRAISLGYRVEYYKLWPLCCRRPCPVSPAAQRRSSSVRVADRRVLDDVRPGRADDADRRDRHDPRPGRRRFVIVTMETIWPRPAPG